MVGVQTTEHLKMSAPVGFWQRYPYMFSSSSDLRVQWFSTVNTPRSEGATCARCLATGLWFSQEGCGLGLGS